MRYAKWTRPLLVVSVWIDAGKSRKRPCESEERRPSWRGWGTVKTWDMRREKHFKKTRENFLRTKMTWTNLRFFEIYFEIFSHLGLHLNEHTPVTYWFCAAVSLHLGALLCLHLPEALAEKLRAAGAEVSLEWPSPSSRQKMTDADAAVPCQTAKQIRHFMSFHVISCHFMSFHVISCHFMSFHYRSYA